MSKKQQQQQRPQMDEETMKNFLTASKWVFDVKANLDEGRKLEDKPTEALVYFNKGLEILKQHDDNSREMRTTRFQFINGIAQCHFYLQQIDLALLDYKECLKLSQSLGNNEDIALSAFHVGLIYYKLNKMQEAFEYCEMALPLVRKYAPDWMSEILATFLVVDDFLEKYEHGLKICEESLIISKNQFGSKSSEHATILFSKANFLHLLERSFEAIPIFKESMEIRKKVLGETNPDYLRNVRLLGQAYCATADYENGFKYLSQAMESYEKLGTDQEAYASCLSSLATICDKTEQHETSLKMRKKALSVVVRIHGRKGVEIVTILQDYGCTLVFLKRNAEALKIFDEVLEILKSTDPSKQYIVNQCVCPALVMKAEVLRELGKPEEGIALLESYFDEAKRLKQSSFDQLVERLAAMKTKLGIVPLPEILELNNMEQERKEKAEKAKQRLKEIEERQKEQSKCHVCGDLTTNRCGGCQKVYYCGRDCQRSNWKEHKPICKA